MNNSIDIYFYIEESQITDELIAKIADWYFNKLDDSWFESKTTYELSQVIGQGSSARAYILDPNNPDKSKRKIIKEFFPRKNNGYLLDEDRKFASWYQADKEEFPKRLKRFCEAARNAAIVRKQYIDLDGTQMLDIGLCFTSLGICQCSPYFTGTRLDKFMQEHPVTSLSSFQTALKYFKKMLADLSVYHECDMINGDVKDSNMWYLPVDPKLDPNDSERTDCVRTLDFGSVLNISYVVDLVKRTDNPCYNIRESAGEFVDEFESTELYYSKKLLLAVLEETISTIRKERSEMLSNDGITYLHKLYKELDYFAVIKLFSKWVLGTFSSSNVQRMKLLVNNLFANEKADFKKYHIVYMIDGLFREVFFVEASLQENKGIAEAPLIDISRIYNKIDILNNLLTTIQKGGASYIDNHENLGEHNDLLVDLQISTMNDLAEYVEKTIGQFVPPIDIIIPLKYE